MSKEEAKQQLDNSALSDVVKSLHDEAYFHLTEQLELVRAENQQINLLVKQAVTSLSDSFHSMDSLSQQNQDSHSLSQKSQQMTETVGRAVAALQFEDMCSQLSEHISRRLDAITELSGLVDELHGIKMNSVQLEDHRSLLTRIELSLSELKPKIDSVAHQAVKQQDMQAGEIELF